jgi:hypothetical protein
MLFTLAGSGLGGGCFVVFSVNLTEICGYAKPNSTTLLHFMEETELCPQQDDFLLAVHAAGGAGAVCLTSSGMLACGLPSNETSME